MAPPSPCCRQLHAVILGKVSASSEDEPSQRGPSSRNLPPRNRSSSRKFSRTLSRVRAWAGQGEGLGRAGGLQTVH